MTSQVTQLPTSGSPRKEVEQSRYGLKAHVVSALLRSFISRGLSPPFKGLNGSPTRRWSTAHRQYIEKMCLPMCEFLASGNFYAHGRILPPNRGVALHIPQTWTPRREKRKRGRWGVCKAPTGASPRKPPIRSFFATCIFQAATILGNFLKRL